MNATVTYIAARTAHAIKRTRDRQSWYDHKLEIIRVLDSLQPDKPEDDSQGFLAYNVDGHKRMKMRTGRFLTRKLRLNNNNFLFDATIQGIAAQINTKLFGGTFEIRLDKGQQITRNYEDSVGSNSCMCGSNAGYTRLYEANPSRFQMLVMVSINDTARAIVHKLDNGTYHMSRVYATSEDLKQRMTDYACEQGWFYYNDNIADKSTLIVSGLNYRDDEIPYMDSLKGYRIENGLLTLTHTANKYEGLCESTCGELENGYTCCCCDEYVSEEDMVGEEGEIYCIDCHSNTFSYCENCNEAYLNGEVHYVESACMTVCQGCLDNDYTLCDDCNEYFKDDKTYSVDDGDKSVCQSCLENYNLCNNCGEYFSDTIYDEDKQLDYCTDCTEDNKIKDCEGRLLLSTE